ncbi:aldo kereductase [Rhizoctonia solani]|uniref:Aldo kereductase n=1 Tax=Rhizoctonia solani TaxID=456999 RepID=A0A8H7LEI9_9AGAM|nr:aldo kereductase [Rhizoctonia solani]
MADPNSVLCLETTVLGPFTVPRVWTGLWQLSSPAWGTAPSGKIKREMARHVAEGYTAFADHYGSAELLFGQFRQTLSDPSIVVGATKWCVFAPTVVTRAVVEEGVRERMERMKYDKVDLLQPMPKTHAPASVSVSVPAQTNMLLFPAPAAVGSALQGRIV